jgi:predicted DCC family thiol-disulfide oxidoreductase YuxK
VAEHPAPARPTLLYDVDCGFCRWSLGKVLAWDRRRTLRTVALQAPEADELLGPMDDEVKMRSWHLVTPSGERYSGGDVAAPLMRLLPAGAPVARLAVLSPELTRRAYSAVATRRSWFGRRLSRQSIARADARIAQRP